MFEQTRVRNALLPPCALVAVADLVGGASADPTARQRRLSVTQAARDGNYRAAESLNPPSPPELPAPRPAPRTVDTRDDEDVRSDGDELSGGLVHEDTARDQLYRDRKYHDVESLNPGGAETSLNHPGGYPRDPEVTEYSAHRYVGPYDETEEGEARRSVAYDAVVHHLNWQFHYRNGGERSEQLREHRTDVGPGRTTSHQQQADQELLEHSRGLDNHESRAVDPLGATQGQWGRTVAAPPEPHTWRDGGGETGQVERVEEADAAPGGVTRITQYAHPLKRAQKFQSVDNMRPSPAPSAATRSRLHLSTPELSSSAGRAAALPAPRLVAPPPPRDPPPPPEAGAEEAVYDAPRHSGRVGQMSVAVEDLVQEVVALRKENDLLRYRAQHGRSPAKSGERTDGQPERRRRQESLRAARRHVDALERENERLTETNRRLSSENSQLRAEPSREDSVVLRQLVVRLSGQLARRQGLPPPEPSDTPLLTDTRRLPPLLDAYDQVQAELTEQVDSLRTDLSELRRQLTEITAENERLHAQISDAQSKPGVSHQEWRSVSENARLVLEENQLLKQQVQLLKDRLAVAADEHRQRESDLSTRVSELETSSAELRSQLQAEQRVQEQLCSERDRVQDQLRNSVAREQHEQAVAECRRLFEELRGQYTSDRFSLLADTEALQAERRRLVVQLTDAATQRTAAETKLRAASKTIARLERRVSSLQGELEAMQKANAEASEHLAEVLSASDQLMAERSQLARLSHNQLSGGDKLIDKISEQRAINLKLKDKVKSVRKESLQQLDQLQFEMGDQARSHETRIAEYERQLVYLRCRVNEKQMEVDHLQSENRRIGEEMAVLSRAATAENMKLREQLLQNVPERDTSSSATGK